MASYLQVTLELLSRFLRWDINQIPRSQNANADLLAKLASCAVTNLKRAVPVQFLDHPSIVPDISVVYNVQDSSPSNWMTPILGYLRSALLPDGNAIEV